MKLDTWRALLRAAARPMDSATLMSHAQRVLARASALTMDATTFHVTRTASGLRFSATPPSERARRALARAVNEQLPAIRADLADDGRERLIHG